MHVIVCLDDAKGMLFHHRRQSQDQVLKEKVQAMCAGRRLWMNGYSHKLYAALDHVELRVEEDFLRKAAKEDFCLVETEHLKPVEEAIERLIIFWWNRKYPADLTLDLDLRDWVRITSEDFPGFSHDRITAALYQRKGI